MKSPQLPYPKISEVLGLESEVWLKREDKHHLGSHKGRSVPLMVAEYHKLGLRNFVVSSSGNMVLAALRTIQSHNKNKSGDKLTLQIFVGNRINTNKLEILTGEITNLESVRLEQVENPKQRAFAFEKETGAKWLRSSADPLALVGYQSLAEELAKIERLAAVFIPTSSGTTAEGLALGFKTLNLNPQIHIIQTDACHPIVSHMHVMQGRKMLANNETPSLADAIVDLVGLRKQSVLEVIESSHGSAWVANNENIKEAIEFTQKTTGLEISPNSALSIVGLLQAVRGGLTWDGPVVCLITGN